MTWSGWFPGRARAAVSVTFDDARPSQLDRGIPVLDAHGLRATFYALPRPLAKRVDDWKRVVSTGHEIGNHTMTHPCSANKDPSRPNPLEDVTLDFIVNDIARADDEIDSLLGVRPRTFAYPCGQTAVGRGELKASYVPVVARQFLAGRGYKSESANDPAVCDAALLDAFHGDGMAADELLDLVEDAIAHEQWAIFALHDVGDGGKWEIAVDQLDRFCARLADDRRVWVAPVAEVAERLTKQSGRGARLR